MRMFRQNLFLESVKPERLHERCPLRELFVETAAAAAGAENCRAGGFAFFANPSSTVFSASHVSVHEDEVNKYAAAFLRAKHYQNLSPILSVE